MCLNNFIMSNFRAEQQNILASQLPLSILAFHKWNVFACKARTQNKVLFKRLLRPFKLGLLYSIKKILHRAHARVVYTIFFNFKTSLIVTNKSLNLFTVRTLVLQAFLTLLLISD